MSVQTLPRKQNFIPHIVYEFHIRVLQLEEICGFFFPFLVILETEHKCNVTKNYKTSNIFSNKWTCGSLTDSQTHLGKLPLLELQTGAM